MDLKNHPVKKRICVYCGAYAKAECFATVAKELGQSIAKRNAVLIYGGGTLGLMGEVAMAAHNAGGEVVGIIPEIFSTRDDIYDSGESIIVSTFNIRKDLLLSESDAIIALPGGVGTLDELFDVWNKAKVNIHSKPIGLLNVHHYYDHLVDWIHSAIDDGFIAKEAKEYFTVADSVEDILDQLYRKM